MPDLTRDLWILAAILLLSILIGLLIVSLCVLNDVYRHAVDERQAWRENVRLWGVYTAICTAILLSLTHI